MRTVLQRVLRASVRVDGEVVGSIAHGALLLVGVEKGDRDEEADETARKVAALRFFPGRTPMDKTLAEVSGSVLVVSQFTLLASLAKGNRPSFDRAEAPEPAARLFLRIVERLRASGLPVETGRFRAAMQVELVNDGPVTLVLEVRPPGAEGVAPRR
jgi:D-tyrosyl-tRNA(Tyr) deacylase